MIKRATRILALAGAAGALAFGSVGVAQARHGADDPPGQHQEHANGEVHHGGHRHHGRHHHHGRGHDDGSGHHRHGNDDGPNHT